MFVRLLETRKYVIRRLAFKIFLFSGQYDNKLFYIPLFIAFTTTCFGL